MENMPSGGEVELRKEWTTQTSHQMLEPKLGEHVQAKDNEQEVQQRVDGVPRKFLVVFLFLFENTLPDSFNHAFQVSGSKRVAL